MQFLGNDPTFAPDGIDVHGDIEDETIGKNKTVSYTISLKNKSTTSLANVKVRPSTTSPDIEISTDELIITNLKQNEMENVVFQVKNITDPAVVVDTFTIQAEIEHTAGVVPLPNDFVCPS